MTLWFGPAAGFRPEAGYFYLCPSCYQACIAPMSASIVHRLAEHSPFARKPQPRSDPAWSAPDAANDPAPDNPLG